MKEFKIDKNAMYFTKDNYGVNVFWRDMIGQRGFRFFLHQLIKGVKILLDKSPTTLDAPRN